MLINGKDIIEKQLTITAPTEWVCADGRICFSGTTEVSSEIASQCSRLKDFLDISQLIGYATSENELSTMKTIDLKRPFKYNQVREILKETLVNGEFQPGEQFPSQNELSRKFNVGHNTVREAISALVHEGLLFRRQGKGTFVTDGVNAQTQQRTAGIFMPSHGHVYGEMASHLIQNLAERNYYPLAIDAGVYLSEKERTEKLTILRYATSAGCIIDGLADFPFDALAQHQPMNNLIFIHRFEDMRHTYDADYVLSDYRDGGYQVIRHLCELGHKKIGLFTYHPSPRYPGEPPRIPDNPVFCELVEGCRRAMHDSGLEPEKDFTIILDIRPGQSLLEELLAAKDRPTAVFAFGDDRGIQVLRMAKKLGIKAPEELSVAGYYNTPWVGMADIALTSVYIEEDIIAEKTAEILDMRNQKNGQDRPKEKMYVKPKLIVRESTREL